MQLALNGEEIGEGIQSDPELLMTIMEARETIENTDSQAELEEFANIFSRQQDDCIKVVSAFTLQTFISLNYHSFELGLLFQCRRVWRFS